jgi:RHS repeat-associated protein
VQHAEYFPGGELWADEVNGSYQQRRPAYLFTGKELDEATGLYYYGARYYDPRQGQWLSPDPALGDYVTGEVASSLYVLRHGRKSRRAQPMAGARPGAGHPPARTWRGGCREGEMGAFRPVLAR